VDEVYVVCPFMKFISAKIRKKGIKFYHHLIMINIFIMHKLGSRLFLNKYDKLLPFICVTL
jgi:hypothetical protein